MAGNKPGKPVGATAERTRQRITLIIDMLIAGYGKREIMQINAKGTKDSPAWNVSYSQVTHYIAQAEAELTKQHEAKRELHTAKSIARKEHLFAKALADKDYKTCHAIQRGLDTLLALDSPAQTPASTDSTAGSMDDLVAVIEAASKQFNGV